MKDRYLKRGGENSACPMGIPAVNKISQNWSKHWSSAVELGALCSGKVPCTEPVDEKFNLQVHVSILGLIIWKWKCSPFDTYLEAAHLPAACLPTL